MNWPERELCGGNANENCCLYYIWGFFLWCWRVGFAYSGDSEERLWRKPNDDSGAFRTDIPEYTDGSQSISMLVWLSFHVELELELEALEGCPLHLYVYKLRKAC